MYSIKKEKRVMCCIFVEEVLEVVLRILFVNYMFYIIVEDLIDLLKKINECFLLFDLYFIVV